MIPGGGKRVGDLPSGGNPIPEGTYHLRADKSVLEAVKGVNAKNKGAAMAAVMFSVFGPADQEEHVGRKIFDRFMLEGEGLWRARQYFEAAGEGPDFVIEDTDQFLNHEVAAVIAIEPATMDPNDNTKELYPAKNVVKKYLPLG